MIEAWKKIDRWPYEVSNFGRVRRLGSKTTRKLVENCRTGYLQVKLCSVGRCRLFAVHRLVCETFHGKTNDLQVSHKDGDKKNNRADNLEWATQSQNEQRKREHGTYQFGEKNPNVRLSDNEVAELRRLRKLGYGVQDLADRFDVSIATVSRTCNFKRRK